MEHVIFDDSQVRGSMDAKTMAAYKEQVRQCHEQLHQGTGKGSAYLGWLTLPLQPDREEIARIKAVAKQIREEAEAFVVVGIGGSYLGARAAVEMLTHTFANELPRAFSGGPRIYFSGHQVSGTYLGELVEVLEGQDVWLNVISKSGMTMEPALSFRVLRNLLEKRFGEAGAARRILVTTDEHRGALRQLALDRGYERFRVPPDIGGRYSVLSAVGLLPMAAAGISIDQVMAGAAQAAADLNVADLEENPCYRYAVWRNFFYTKEKGIELLATYEPKLHYLGEWYKQLFGESEGKKGEGIFPTSVNFTTDLHSLGQYIQEGRRVLFETVVAVETPQKDVRILEDSYNQDQLNRLSGRSFDEVNQIAMAATTAAHSEGGVPTLLLRVPELTPYHYGYLVYFLMKACAMSGYLLGVNPFDQPGVEKYKAKMEELLK